MFWNAFGAIGTTIGSLITAIAVVVAVNQYKQPLLKRIKITLNTSYPVCDYGLGESYFCINIANIGIRPVVITNIYLNAGKQNIVINKLMIDIESDFTQVNFPKEIKPEDRLKVYISHKKLVSAFNNILKEGQISEKQKLKVLATDTTSGNYYCQTGLTAKRITTHMR